MNRGCYGHRFELSNREFYRCPMDGLIAQGPVLDDSICPVCNRIVSASIAKFVNVKRVVTIDCSRIGQVEIFEDEFPGELEL